MRADPVSRPRIVLLADRPGWAFDFEARALARALSSEFDLHIAYAIDRPDLDSIPLDLIVVLFWGEEHHLKFVHDPRRVIKQVASHRWAHEDRYGRLTPRQFVDAHLWDAATVVCISKRLQAELAPYRDVLHAPQGIDAPDLGRGEPRQGPLVFGWAGNALDESKGLSSILQPAAGGEFDLRVAAGGLSWPEMVRFYASIDVLCVASSHEGEPRPLIEGMIAGTFPVAVDVGVVPELVTHRSNGLIVRRNIAAFRAAFQWCTLNARRVRAMGMENVERTKRLREVSRTALVWRGVLIGALALNGIRPAACGAGRSPEDGGNPRWT